MLGQVAASEDAGVHFRVQGLHPAVEHLRETGVVANFDDRHTRLTEQPGGPARRQYVEAECMQCAGELGRTGLSDRLIRAFACSSNAV